MQTRVAVKLATEEQRTPRTYREGYGWKSGKRHRRLKNELVVAGGGRGGGVGGDEALGEAQEKVGEALAEVKGEGVVRRVEDAGAEAGDGARGVGELIGGFSRAPGRQGLDVSGWGGPDET